MEIELSHINPLLEKYHQDFAKSNDQRTEVDFDLSNQIYSDEKKMIRISV